MKDFSLVSYMLNGLVLNSLVMSLLWALQLRLKNAGYVDVAWAYQTGLTAVVMLFLVEGGLDDRKILLVVMAAAWSLRLGTYLLRRLVGQPEDSRYAYLREYSGKYASIVMFLFFQLQASWVVIFAMPYVVAGISEADSLRMIDFIGVIIWLCAMLGEATADRQLSQFKSDPDNKGKVCSIGLWHYSRHPNYFFEWVMWWAFVFIGYGSPHWWVTIAGVLIMYVFINHITGVPFSEQQSLRSRGSAYRDYQRVTSRFFPMPSRITEGC